jgi:hypothetical protein
VRPGVIAERPSASSRRGSVGQAARFRPTRKNVARPPERLSILSTAAVYGPGPSSKVSAIACPR